MLLSTRDAQRERRSSQILATAAVAHRLSSVGIDNASFRADSLLDLRSSHILSRGNSQINIAQQSPALATENTDQNRTREDGTQQTIENRKKYGWRMTHYFYIHICLFICTGFLCGLIVWLIENYSSARNTDIKVDYIDAWFVSSSCVSSCGLTTIDFAKLSRASQVILMIFTFISGITISTLPALVLKAQTHKKVEGITVDDDHGELTNEATDDELPTFNIRQRTNLPQHVRDKIATLPSAAKLRYRAYITCIFLTLGTCFTIYLIGFIAIGSWLSGQYTPDQLLQGNSSVNPWYISFIVTVTGFNQNGLVPLSDGFARFVYDTYLNLFVMMIVVSGTSLFPFILRNVVKISRLVCPWRHKIIFDYILMNNHRLSTLLFPAVQTRIYLFVTILLYIMGVGISLILDFERADFSKYSKGTRFLIFLFHTVNTRFAGFQSIDMNQFAAGTLLFYLLLMATKPQMLCAIDESPFEISWLAVEAQEEVDAHTNKKKSDTTDINLAVRSPSGSISSASVNIALPIRQMEHFLRRQSLVTKTLAREYFANAATTAATPLDSGNNENEDDTQSTKESSRYLKLLRFRLFLVYFARALLKHTLSFIILTRTWLFFFIFLICAIEYRRMAPVDPNITVFKVIFEIVSAFGTVGLSLGYPNVPSSFSTVLSPASKVIIILTMLMGRHRGLLASMKDQEAIEHSAIELLNRRRAEITKEYELAQPNANTNQETKLDDAVVRF